MEQVQAWKDNGGAIHKTKLEAAGADFVMAVEKVWALFPNDDDKGNAQTVAKCLMAGIKARSELADAIDAFDDANHAVATPREMEAE